jgi:hypothetical protein
VYGCGAAMKEEAVEAVDEVEEVEPDRSSRGLASVCPCMCACPCVRACTLAFSSSDSNSRKFTHNSARLSP